MVLAMQDINVEVTTIASSTVWSGAPIDDSPMWDSVREKIDIATPSQPNLMDSVVMAARFHTTFYSRWIGRVVTAARSLHRVDPFDLVYSRSVPSVAHMAGYWCAMKLGLPWIANINDPWVFNFFVERGNTMGYTAPEGIDAEFPRFSALEARAHLFWLRRTLRKADLITYPCKGLHTFHIKLANVHHAAQIIPHVGYRSKRTNHEPSSQFRLVHAGSLGSSEVTGRSTKALLLGLKAFLQTWPDAASHTKLVLVGPEDKDTQSLVYGLDLERNVENVGRVNYQESLDYIASASICILIEATMEESIFFPSKLADYLASGKPVLAFSPGKGLAADLAIRGELVRVSQNDAEEVRTEIGRFYSKFRCGTLNSCGPSEQLRAQLQGHTVAEKFLSVCQVLISTRSEDRATRLERIKEHLPFFESFS